MKKAKRLAQKSSQPLSLKKYQAPSQVPLVPAWLLLPLWFISMALQNIILVGMGDTASTINPTPDAKFANLLSHQSRDMLLLRTRKD